MILSPGGLLAFGRRIPVTIGRGGITSDKHEGDGATPAGRLLVLATLYRADRVASPGPWAQPVGPRDLWCDEAGCADYNRLVQAPFAASHEVMRRADPLYDLVLVTDWNTPALAGRGSAIFLHQWRRPGSATAGCIAMGRRDLLWLGARVRPGTPLHVPPLAGHPPRWRAGGQV